MKKLFAVISAAVIVMMAITAAVGLRAAFADKNAPPDETIQDTTYEQTGSDGESADKEKKEKADAEARAAKEAAARRARERAAAAAAAEAKKIEAARKAEEARLAEEARRAASEDLARRIMQSGVDYVAQGRYQTAINVLRGYPNSADAWYWISRAHHAMGDYDKAQAAVNIALEIDPYYPLLTKTPSGLEPVPPRTKAQKKEPRPSMSVLPVKPLLPMDLAIEPVTISFPYLESGRHGGASASGKSSASGGAYLRYEPYPPMPPGRTTRWMASSEKFAEIGRWRFRVDRMGIMQEPRVPVAWKGTRPYEVYFWTGWEWARISRRAPKERFDAILKRASGDIASIIEGEGLPWDENDTPALAAAASLMRYMWVGDVDFNSGKEDEEDEGGDDSPDGEKD